MSYFKTNHPEVIAAFNENSQRRKALADRADQFAIEFGGEAIFLKSGGVDTWFGGLKFAPPKPSDLWRKPDAHGCQHPRTSLAKGTKEERKQLKELNDLYTARTNHFNLNERVSRDDFLKSIGTHWGQVMFSGMSYFLHDGFIYVDTTAKLNDKVTEILGSEFNAAENAHDKAKKEQAVQP